MMQFDEDIAFSVALELQQADEDGESRSEIRVHCKHSKKEEDSGISFYSSYVCELCKEPCLRAVVIETYTEAQSSTGTKLLEEQHI